MSSSSQRSQIARLGGLAAYARNGPAQSAPARAAAQTTLNERLIAEYGLDRSALSPDEFAHRLQAARSAYYGTLGLKSGVVRRKRHEAKQSRVQRRSRSRQAASGGRPDSVQESVQGESTSPMTTVETAPGTTVGSPLRTFESRRQPATDTTPNRTGDQE